ncbi:hypothetical protein KCV87_24520 [Actinosynnema pretiosum subsp. pretiosum]|uniref:Outer membrane channel protein CpnT-like N-terminal domain-containing protein n=1 Tax=Actinosynnema pretiosum subsp. pretiosum TaxID=103721 RepID=A0AA45L341_9PSEU|nr:hypothetical protein APASM_6240 [Actinosynnema pretiosum subsp. pretiosum]QUF02604.1 hypothetical protein KCV87_24520 [Actinosynnema pretiosum subsp. pretiosum]
MVEWTGFGDGGGWTNPDNFAGAGPVESVFQLIDSGKRAGEGDVAEIAMNLGAAGLDLLGAALDPLGALGTAGIGWLIEHVSFLREPLDYLAGNGDRIKAAVTTWNESADALRRVAKAQHDAVETRVSGWRQRAAEGFRGSQRQLAKETVLLSDSCTRIAEEIAAAGTITATIRGVIRDLISMFVWEVVRNAAIALASSVVSMGSSIAAFTAWAVGRGALVLGKITQRLSKLVSVVTRILSRIKQLTGALGHALKGLARFGKKAGGGAPTPSAPRFPGLDGLGKGLDDVGKRLADRGTTAPSLSDAAAKAKQGGREFVDGYKDAGTVAQKFTEQNHLSAADRYSGIADRYTPFTPRTRADGTVSPHSTPSFDNGGFQIKTTADYARESAKEDELREEGITEEARQFKRQTGYLD